MMKTVIFSIMLIALYLLYRVAFPKQAAAKKDDAPPQKTKDNLSDVAGKSRFVMPAPGQPQTTPATPEKNDSDEENAPTFATGNENRDMAIPPERLDDAFNDDPNPEDLDVEPDESETNGGLNEVEEAKDLPQITARDAELADGLTIEEMAATVDATQNPTEEKAELLYRTEKTDLFEQLVSGDAGKELRIRAIIERHMQSLNPEVEHETDDSEVSDSFDIQRFLS